MDREITHIRITREVKEQLDNKVPLISFDDKIRVLLEVCDVTDEAMGKAIVKISEDKTCLKKI